MLKKLSAVIMIALIVAPGMVFADQRFGIGGCFDLLSGGVEFRFWMPTQKDASFYLAPHLIGVFTSSSSSSYFFYSVGLNAGVVFKPQHWIAPLVGLGVGHSSDDGDSYVLGGRVFTGLSIAPFEITQNESSWMRGLAGLRFDITSGLLGRMVYNSFHYGTFQASDLQLIVPDIGASIVFSW
jgi:opacity protein-like surface antigen